mgnify:CR=1 FL=1
MHQITGKSMIGLSLALTTAVLWGMLPIALKILLDVLTANTITAVRFLVAAVMQTYTFVMAASRRLRHMIAGHIW